MMSFILHGAKPVWPILFVLFYCTRGMQINNVEVRSSDQEMMEAMLSPNSSIMTSLRNFIQAKRPIVAKSRRPSRAVAPTENPAKTIIDAYDYLNKTREVAVKKNKDQEDRKCKAMCLTTLIVDTLSLVLATTGWMSCPMLLAIVPLWWSLGVITFMVDGGMDFAMANKVLNEIVTTIGFGSQGAAASKYGGIAVFHSIHALVSYCLVGPVVQDLTDAALDIERNLILKYFPKVKPFFEGIGGRFVQCLTLMSVAFALNMIEYNGAMAQSFYQSVIVATTIGFGEISYKGDNLIGYHLISPFLTKAFANLQGDIMEKLGSMPTYGKAPGGDDDNHKLVQCQAAKAT